MIETIKVKRDGAKGFHIINKADFVEGKHQIYDPEGETAAEEAAKAEADALAAEEAAKAEADAARTPKGKK
jgi:hypothetical protein